MTPSPHAQLLPRSGRSSVSRNGASPTVTAAVIARASARLVIRVVSRSGATR